jgi:enamidase
MPLGVIKTVAELASFSGIDPAMIWAAATGNSARVWDLPSGVIEVGRAADLVVLDAPWGSTRDDALGGLAIGDIPGITAVITGGQLRNLTSRNTPRAARLATVTPDMPHLAATGH